LDKHYEKWTRFERARTTGNNDLGLFFCNRRMRRHSDDKLREKMIRPLLMSLKMYSPGKVFHAIRHGGELD